MPHAAVNQASMHLQPQLSSNLTKTVPAVTPGVDLSSLMSQMKLGAVGNSSLGGLPLLSGRLGLPSAMPAMSGVGLDIVPGWSDFLHYVSQTDSNMLVQAAASGSLLGPHTLQMLAARGGCRSQQNHM